LNESEVIIACRVLTVPLLGQAHALAEACLETAGLSPPNNLGEEYEVLIFAYCVYSQWHIVRTYVRFNNCLN